MHRLLPFWGLLLCLTLPLNAADGNRLSYLEGCHPYAPSGTFPKLITPQWVGDKEVEAVIILAIDDMSDPAKYEAYMRPILNRLKQIDGRAPISIMTNKPKWDHSQLTQWLSEGLSIDVHTVDHPCPLFNGGDFEKAKSTYNRCVELLNEIPGNKPVAYRMPCCDSQNTVSPRFYSEIFNGKTKSGYFLQASSSVFTVFTTDQKNSDLPNELLSDPDGKNKFEKYLPNKSQFGNLYLNYIENYPYPYVINQLCWEFPSLVPSDWSAQNYSRPNNPETLRDFKAAIDLTVLKKGVLTLTFHPHGWIDQNQMVEFVDFADKKYGNKIRFLTFPEALERMKTHLLAGNTIRNSKGDDNSVRILDVNNDGYMDVVFTKNKQGKTSLITRLWQPESNSWQQLETEVIDPSFTLKKSSFGQVNRNQNAALIAANHEQGDYSGLDVYTFEGNGWELHPSVINLNQQFGKVNDQARAKLSFDDARLNQGGQGNVPRDYHLKPGSYLLRDINNDGFSELIIHSRYLKVIYEFSPVGLQWKQLPFTLPPGAMLLDDENYDAGLRFVDINQDGWEDLVISNEEYYSAWLFTDKQKGWDSQLLSGDRGKKDPAEEIPRIVRTHGEDNGAWFSRGFMWIQNEDTSNLPDYVDRRELSKWLE